MLTSYTVDGTSMLPSLGQLVRLPRCDTESMNEWTRCHNEGVGCGVRGVGRGCCGLGARRGVWVSTTRGCGSGRATKRSLRANYASVARTRNAYVFLWPLRVDSARCRGLQRACRRSRSPDANHDASARKRLADVRQSSIRTHSASRRDQPVVTTLKKEQE